MAPEIGKTLRDARTKRGIELSEVERVTKIRQKFLTAMEEDRWDELPAPVYAKGFLSTYGRYLGLDVEPLLDRYREAFGDPERPEHVPAGAVHTGEMRRGRGRRGAGPRTRSLVVAGLVTVVLLALVIAAVVGGSDSGGGNGKKTSKATLAGKPGHRTSTSTTTSSTTITSTSTSTTPTPSQVSVELRSTADVWVCLIDQSGRRLVNSETLPADQTRGPYTGTGFEMTFGNGSVELTVNGQPVKVPQLAQPLGYRITTTETKRLKPSSQPSCV
jgi:cytoskeleton protein RodZ